MSLAEPLAVALTEPLANKLTARPAPSGGGGGTLLTDLAEWWDLAEVSGNRVGNHANLTLTQSGTVGSGLGIGDAGVAAEFDGVDDKLQIADNATLSMGTDTAITIAFWMRPNTSGFCWIINKDDGGSLSGIEYKVKMSSGLTMGGGIGNGVTGDDGDFAGLNATDVAWNFVVWQHDPTANVQQCSLDNGAFVTRAWSGGTWDGPTALAVGAYSGGSQWFKGRLSRLGIWKRLLTGDEITDLYNGGAGRAYSEL